MVLVHVNRVWLMEDVRSKGNNEKKNVYQNYPPIPYIFFMFSMIWRDLEVIIHPPIFPLFGNKPQNKPGGLIPIPSLLKASQT